MGCKLFDRYGRHGDCANCPYDCDEPNAETAVSEDVDEEDEMNEQSFTDAMLDLRQAVAKQMGSHQAYVQTKVDALVAAHQREMMALRFEKKEANND